MNSDVNSKWQNILHKQRIANIKRWISEIQNTSDASSLLSHEYENILRSLESALSIPSASNLVYDLIQVIHLTVLDFADWNRWLIYLQQLLDSSHFTDPLKRANLYIQIGDVRAKTGELTSAEESYNKGIDTFKILNQTDDLAVALGRLSIVFSQKGEFTKAKSLCQEALRLANMSRNLEIASKINLNLSFIYYWSRDSHASLKHAKTAFENFKQLEMNKDATKALLNIISNYAELGRWSDVEVQTQALIADYTELGDIIVLCQLKNTIGIAAFNQKKYFIAESSWHEALLLYTQMEESSEVASIYNNLGMVYTKLEEWEASEVMLIKAINAYEELGNVYYKANAQDNLADLYRIQERLGSARTVLQVAIDELKSIEPNPHIVQLIEQMQEKLENLQEIPLS